MGVVFVVAAVLAICMASATPEQIRHSRANPPSWLNVAYWMSIVVLVLLVGQFFIPGLN